MQNVGAAWLMTSLTPSPVVVVLVQRQRACPFFWLDYLLERWLTSSIAAGCPS